MVRELLYKMFIVESQQLLYDDMFIVNYAPLVQMLGDCKSTWLKQLRSANNQISGVGQHLEFKGFANS